MCNVLTTNTAQVTTPSNRNWKNVSKKGIYNIGGKSQTVYQFARAENKNVKKIFSKGELPLKMDMNLKKISKYSKWRFIKLK